KTEPMHALNERITRRVLLSPLQPDEVDAYIRHRLDVAGGTDVVSFEPDASRLIADLSRGLPRRVNVLCDRALQEGRIGGQGAIGKALVKRAARALAGAPRDTTTDEDGTATDDPSVDLPVGAWRVKRWLRTRGVPIAAAMVGILLVAAALSYGYYARTVLN